MDLHATVSGWSCVFCITVDTVNTLCSNLLSAYEQPLR